MALLAVLTSAAAFGAANSIVSSEEADGEGAVLAGSSGFAIAAPVPMQIPSSASGDAEQAPSGSSFQSSGGYQ